MKSLPVLALAAACTTSADVTVTPSTANVLTCATQQFTADRAVTWSASPGTIDDAGLYSSPLTTPAPASATITATASDATGTASVALATAFPGAPAAIPGSWSTAVVGTVGVYQHGIAANGARAYAAWQDNPDGETHVALRVARSDDGGATWGAPVAAASADLLDGAGSQWLECAAVAVDAGDPDVVYAIARISGPNSLGAAVDDDEDSTLVFAVSEDGGATFGQSVLRTGIIGYCPDVASPAADTVVVEDPVDVCDKDMWVWSDAHRGAGFATGAPVPNSAPGGEVYYLADGATSGLDESDGRDCSDAAKVNLESDGTTDAGGDATEAPRLFTDGAGRVCVSYIGDTTTQSVSHAYAQCSTDAGATFGPLVALDPGAAAGGSVHSQATGALGPAGAAAVAFVRGGGIYVALSTDSGATFAAPIALPAYQGLGAINPSPYYDADGILWLAYRSVDGDGNADHVVVDKSCDGGASWSGPVLVDSSSKWPALVGTTGDAPHLAATGASATSVFALDAEDR